MKINFSKAQPKYHLTADLTRTGERLEMDADIIAPMMKHLRECHYYGAEFEMPDGRSIRTHLLTYRIWKGDGLTLMLHVNRDEPLPVKETVEQAVKDYLFSEDFLNLGNAEGLARLITDRLTKFMD